MCNNFVRLGCILFNASFVTVKLERNGMERQCFTVEGKLIDSQVPGGHFIRQNKNTNSEVIYCNYSSFKFNQNLFAAGTGSTVNHVWIKMGPVCKFFRGNMKKKFSRIRVSLTAKKFICLARVNSAFGLDAQIE